MCDCGFDILVDLLCAVPRLDAVEAVVLLLEDLEVLEDFEDLDVFDVAVETTELCDDLLCRR